MGRRYGLVAGVRTVAMDLLALAMLLSLPGLWIAWSPTLLVGIFGAAVVAAAVYCVLAFFDER